MKHLVTILVFLAAFSSMAQVRPQKGSLPSSVLSTPIALSVLTFNAWDVELLGGLISPSKDVDERFQLMPIAISNLKPDIIVFQEVWRKSRANQLIKSFQALGYPYSIYKAGPGFSIIGFGNGLLIVSKYPLSDTRVMSFRSHTRGDESKGLVYKGAIKTVVSLPGGISVDVYASHLGAFTTVAANEKTPTSDNPPHHFVAAHMRAKADQAQEVAQFVRATRSSPNAILAVDLNTHPHPFENGQYVDSQFSFEYALLTCAEVVDGCLNMVDSFEVANAETESQGVTFDTLNNVYAKTSRFFSAEPPGRIDYIFHSGPHLKLVNSQIVFEFPLAGGGGKAPMLSDHYGVLSVFELKK